MKKEKSKDALALNYKMLSDKGTVKSKSLVINNLSDQITDEDLFQIAQYIQGLLAYSTEKVSRKLDFLLLED